jgi:GNAT superfamily N-acetyltransferase
VVTIADEPFDSTDARELIAELDTYLGTLYPPEENFLELPSADVFLMARDEHAQALGCCALRILEEGDGEVKRMYVRPHARRLGVGRHLLQELEAAARRRGVTRLVLEVGGRQTDALTVYSRAGFSPIPRFGPYVDASNSRCLAKQLSS